MVSLRFVLYCLSVNNITHKFVAECSRIFWTFLRVGTMNSRLHFGTNPNSTADPWCRIIFYFKFMGFGGGMRSNECPPSFRCYSRIRVKVALAKKISPFTVLLVAHASITSRISAGAHWFASRTATDYRGKAIRPPSYGLGDYVVRSSPLVCKPLCCYSVS